MIKMTQKKFTQKIVFGQREHAVVSTAIPPRNLAIIVANEAQKIAQGLKIRQDIPPSQYVTLNVGGIEIDVGVVEYQMNRQGGRSDTSYMLTVYAPTQAKETDLPKVLDGLKYDRSVPSLF